MDRYTYTIVLTPEAGVYAVSVPALPGCVTVGATVEEALAMASDAVALWLEDLADAGEPIPLETEPPRTAIVTVGVRAPALR